MKIGTPENVLPGCPFSREYRHPDAYINFYANMGMPMPTFTVNMGIHSNAHTYKEYGYPAVKVVRSRHLDA